MKTKASVLLVVSIFCFCCGALLLGINVYGLTQPIRKPGLGVDDHGALRFIPQEVWSYQKSMQAIDALASIDDKQRLAQEANLIVNRSLIHVDWERVDPASYRQLVPIWENYFLFFVGRYSGLPQFERYHYADYRRNIRRGIGICGDASTTLSSILDRFDVANRIVSFEGHVLVEYWDDEGKRHLMDPDFGIELGVGLEVFSQNPVSTRPLYVDAGYSKKELDYLFKIYERNYYIFDDTYHFMSKRYLFEKVSYVAKWLLPVALMLLAFVGMRKDRSV
jgi:hypothetical protein